MSRSRVSAALDTTFWTRAASNLNAALNRLTLLALYL